MSFQAVRAASVQPIEISESRETARRPMPTGRRFVKGVSGNPGGMHKGTAELKKIAREWTESAIRTLGAVMADVKAPPAARVAAASAILDRGHGKPTQQVEVGGPGAFAAMSDDELDAFIASSVKLLRDQSRVATD